ncbi:hypothetical protein KF728_09665 [Candidatus Obscuribacterales bacterium]|nr:hypothetical protein [Candidatus Obscuribacterales bacterium]
MKTKVICILLLALFFFAKESWFPCVCSNPVQQTVSQVTNSTPIQVLSDECFDCSHSKTCCFVKAYAEIALADIGALDEIDLPTTIPTEKSEFIRVTRKPSERFLNKAPPERAPLSTPVSLHQKLSI